MSLQTPRRAPAVAATSPGLPVPSSRLTISTGPASPSLLATPVSTAMARKASLNALLGIGPGPEAGLSLGDSVGVPGGMIGTVLFLGPVAGKKGIFAGIELAGRFAAEGKNNGDVSGIKYFTPHVAGSGIFVPAHRATKRPPKSADGPATTPVSEAPRLAVASPARIPGIKPPGSSGIAVGTPLSGRPSLPKLSPVRKMPRPSMGPVSPLPRPGTRNGLTAVASTPRPSLSPIPKTKPQPTEARDQLSLPPTPISARPGSRVRGAVSEAHHMPLPPPSVPMAGPDSKAEIAALRRALQDRDRQIEEQTAVLADMETSLNELQTLIPAAAAAAADRRPEPDESGDLAQLRALIREKNERIKLLTAEFDAHRADFRSTIDTLEMASTETERVYEKRMEELLDELEVVRLTTSVDSNNPEAVQVAEQLGQLENMVADLEIRMDLSRRAEAEARAEADFLRAELDRVRGENLVSWRDGAGMGTDGLGAATLDARDDEIRGLKAIIHSLSSGSGLESPGPNDEMCQDAEVVRLQNVADSLDRDLADARVELASSARREADLTSRLDRVSLSSPAVGSDVAVGPGPGVGAEWTMPSSSPRSRPASKRESDSRVGGIAIGPGMLPTIASSDVSGRLSGEVDNMKLSGMEDGDGRVVSRFERSLPPSLLIRPGVVVAGPAGALSPAAVFASGRRSGPAVLPASDRAESGEMPQLRLPRLSDPPRSPVWCGLCERGGHDITNCPDAGLG